MKAAAPSPKKETAKIQLPPGPKPPMPKATIKMQQTQPMASMPAAALNTAALKTTNMVVDEEDEPMVKILSIVVLLVSLASCTMSYLAYAAV